MTNNKTFLNSVPVQVAALTFAHFVVDFFGGLLLPLPEPTMRNHLHVSLTKVMLIISSSAIVVNAIQPIAGAFLPKKKLPIILLACPLFAAAVAFIGLTDNYWLTWILIMISGLGIGILHPEASMTVQNIAEKKVGLATSFFMSAGFFGFSVGSWTAGWWGQNFKLHNFWLLAIPGILAVMALLLTGLGKAQATKTNSSASSFGKIPFVWVLLTAMIMAINLALIYRMLPIYIVRKFGDNCQSDAGRMLFVIGLFGALGAFVWGYLSDKKGSGLLLILVYLAGMPFYYFLIHSSSPTYSLIPAIFFGITIGGTFPLSVVLARQAKQLALRLRLGLCIGGAWGSGELLVIAATKYIDTFPENAVTPLYHIFLVPWLLMSLVIILGFYVSRKEA